MFRIFIILHFFTYISPLFSSEDLQPLFSVKAPANFTNGKEAFENVMKVVGKKFYNSKGLSENDLYYAAIQGIIRKVSPPNAPTQGKIWSKEQKNKAMGNLQTKQISAGFKYNFEKNEGAIKVLSIEQGAPAEGFLLPNDRIMRINDESLKKKSAKEISALLTGAKGQSLKLTLVRDIKILETELVLKPFKRQYSSAAIINNTAYIRLKSFSDNISGELKKHLARFAKKKIPHLIIDLRHNTGGYFTEAIKSANLFLKKNTPLLSVIRSGSKRTDYKSSNETPFNFKIAILIDKLSASSSEILASALKENNAAVLIGENSYGKAITEKAFIIKNDYYIKFTVGAMYDINGENWHDKGISPSIKLRGTIAQDPAEDAVIQEAIKYLQR